MPGRKKFFSGEAGAQGGRIARNPHNFTGGGVNPRQQRAAQKVESLVSQGYRLNPNAKTSGVYRSAVKQQKSSGRLNRLLKVR